MRYLRFNLIEIIFFHKNIINAVFTLNQGYKILS